MAMVERLFTEDAAEPLEGDERAALRDAFQSRSLTSAWCGYAVPKRSHDDALAFIFTEGGNGGPFKLIRTQAGGYGLASENGLIVWTGASISEIPGAFL
jgi:hypothetical protein